MSFSVSTFVIILLSIEWIIEVEIFASEHIEMRLIWTGINIWLVPERKIGTN